MLDPKDWTCRDSTSNFLQRKEVLVLSVFYKYCIGFSSQTCDFPDAYVLDFIGPFNFVSALPGE